MTSRGAGTLALSQVTVLISWETSPRTLGFGSVGTGGTLPFSVSATPPSPGPWTAEVSMTGQAPGDTGPSTCTRTESIAEFNIQSFTVFPIAIGFVLLICAPVVIAIVV